MPIKKGKVKIRRDDHELCKQLADQVSFLETSATAFDSGRIREAARLATSVRVLLHDTKCSHSLFKQLGLKNLLRYCDTSFTDSSKNLFPYTGLCGMRIGQKTEYWAPLGDRPMPSRKRKIGDWWEAIVVDDKAGNQFSRKDIVLLLANKEGGAHVDPELETTQIALMDGSLLKVMKRDSYGEGFMPDVHLYSMRQIAYEVLETLDPLRPQFENPK